MPDGGVSSSESSLWKREREKVVAEHYRHRHQRALTVLRRECEQVRAEAATQRNAGRGGSGATPQDAAERLANHHKETMKRLKAKFVETLKLSVSATKAAVARHAQEQQAFRAAQAAMMAEKEEDERQRAEALRIWAIMQRERAHADQLQQQSLEKRRENEKRAMAQQQLETERKQQEAILTAARRRTAYLANVADEARKKSEAATSTSAKKAESVRRQHDATVNEFERNEIAQITELSQRRNSEARHAQQAGESRDAWRRRCYDRGMQERFDYSRRAQQQLERGEARLCSWQQGFREYIAAEEEHRADCERRRLDVIDHAKQMQREWEDETRHMSDSKERRMHRSLAALQRRREVDRLNRQLEMDFIGQRVDEAHRAAQFAREAVSRKAEAKARAAEERQELMKTMSNTARLERQRMSALADRCRHAARLGEEIDFSAFDLLKQPALSDD